MKRKSFVVFFSVLFLFVAGSIYYEGIKSHVSASQDISNHPMREFGKKEMEREIQTMVLDEIKEETPNVNTPTPQTNNDNNNDDKEPNNIILPSSQEVPKESEAPKDNQEAILPAEHEDEVLEEKQSDDMIMIDNQKYYNIMDEEKFAHRINIAQKYGAKLYAIPYSDGFAIVKDGVPIIHMSTGVATTKPSNKDILCDLFSDQGEYASGIAEGIQKVVESGESVKVGVTPETTGFAIFKRDDWIVVSW